MPERKTVTFSTAKKANKWVFIKGYPFIVLVCRIILSISQFWVSLDTYVIFNKLLNLKRYRTYDFSLNTLTNPDLDYEWVPTLDIDDRTYDTFGTNKLFNLFIIRLSHKLRDNGANFLFYPAFIIFGFMIFLSILDIIQMVQLRYKLRFASTTITLIRLLLYLATITIVILQYFVVMYSNDTLCHMELLYPFLFSSSNRIDNTGYLLKTGSCLITQRVICCVLVTTAALVPDTFLLILKLLPPLRIYSLLVGTDIFLGILTFSSVFVVYKLKNYINLSNEHDILNIKSSNIIQNQSDYNFENFFSKCKLHNFPIINFNKYINFRITKTFKRLLSNNVGDFNKITYLLDNTSSEYKEQVYTILSYFIENCYIQSSYILNSFINVGIFLSILSLLHGFVGLFTIIKRQKLLIILAIFINFIYLPVNIINVFMLGFTTHGSKFFCNIKDYSPSSTNITFELMALSSWICRVGGLFELNKVVLIIQSLVSFTNMIVLILLMR